MKNVTPILFFGVLATIANGQNLVPNPSFEDIAECPFGIGDLTPIVGWENFGNTPDCFHSCASSAINIPNSGFGFQHAHSGNAMLGIISYVWEQDPGWPNYREYVGVQLLTPLVVGQKYFASFFINCAGYIPGWQHIGANKIGARFSTFQYDNTQPTIPDNFSHIHTDSIVTDTVQWFKVAGSFIADSAYQYIILGNFYDHIHTDTIIFGGPPFGGSVAYYYIDDVCVGTDSLFVNTWTGIKEENEQQTNVILYPNPAGNFITIQSTNILESIEVFNSIGQSVMALKTTQNYQKEINVSALSQGIYYVVIRDETHARTVKIVIN